MSAQVRGGGPLSPQYRSWVLARTVAGAVAGGFLAGVVIGWVLGR